MWSWKLYSFTFPEASPRFRGTRWPPSVTSTPRRSSTASTRNTTRRRGGLSTLCPSSTWSAFESNWFKREKKRERERDDDDNYVAIHSTVLFAVVVRNISLINVMFRGIFMFLSNWALGSLGWTLSFPWFDLMDRCSMHSAFEWLLQLVQIPSCRRGLLSWNSFTNRDCIDGWLMIVYTFSLHFRCARPPVVIFVKLDMTNGDLERLIDERGWVEGEDYVHFSWISWARLEWEENREFRCSTSGSGWPLD